MTLSNGTKLSHYEITSQIGKGGMGEVYQAKDTKLGRDVAIKVLPQEFAKDAARVARFQREAKLLASLNHPNIAAIYGLEESDGTNFLVMELVEGNTLDDRIKSGPIPVEEALKLALQIAEALEAAHEKGVIHRDLKPANIKATPDGKVKVLDFGLAKAFAGEQADLNLSNSPTLSDMATQEGVILGTAAYMSPEQARGKPVDKRADIWAFGVVLFEMLTGKSLFSGEDVSSTLAKVLEREPDFSTLPQNLHSRIREMLERCLQKDPKNRYSGIGDARFDIQRVLADPSGVFVKPVSTEVLRTRMRTILPWITTAVVAAVIITWITVWHLKPNEPREVICFSYELPEDQQFPDTVGPNFAISPDGRQFIYSTRNGIYRRSMNEMKAKRIPGTVGNIKQPFFSPDGDWIGYWSIDDTQLMIIPVSGGDPHLVCNDTNTAYYHWGEDGNIYYAGDKGIMRVSKNGGTPVPLIKAIDNETFFSPQLLPDGKSVLFIISTNAQYQIAVQSFDSNDRKILPYGASIARYLPTGHIVYVLGNDLNAVPFDIDERKQTGDPVTMIQGIYVNGPPHLYISESGTLAYLENIITPRALVWVDLKGNEEILKDTPSDIYSTPKISADGTRIALVIADSIGNQDIGIWNTVRQFMTPLVSGKSSNSCPNWINEDKEIVFSHGSGADVGVYRIYPGSPGNYDKIHTESGQQICITSRSEDGNILLGSIQPPGFGNQNIGMLVRGDNPEWQLLLQEDCNENNPQISPDGEWMAYTSDKSGQTEVWVCSFPEVDRERGQISTNGGISPLWAPNGRKLYYRDGEYVMSVTIETKPRLNAGFTQSLFPDTYYRESSQWDIHPDGNKFLMMKDTSSESDLEKSQPTISIIVNWFEELKQKVPIP